MVNVLNSCLSTQLSPVPVDNVDKYHDAVVGIEKHAD